MNSAEIKKTIQEHNSYASKVMNTDHQTRENTLLLYKNFIDTDPIIKDIIKDIIILSKDAPDLFIKSEYNILVSKDDSDEKKDMAILYKHLNYMVEMDAELRVYAFSIYYYEKKYDSAISKLLTTSVKPLIGYIQQKLNELLIDAEEDEKKEQRSSIHNGDNYFGPTQKVGNGNASMENMGNDNSKKKFIFQKESFFLGILSSVIAGLIIFGIEELIRFLSA